MAEPIAIGLRGFLAAAADLAAFDDHVGVVALTLDLEHPEAQQSRVHRVPRGHPAVMVVHTYYFYVRMWGHPNGTATRDQSSDSVDECIALHVDIESAYGQWPG